jgi:hypothetical protein
MFALLALSLAAAPALIGCDDTLEHEKKVDVKDDGTVVTKEHKVTQSPDGTVKETETKDVDEVD